MTKILAHHGSPGTPNDFDFLKQEVKADWKCVNRYLKEVNINSDDSHIVGYSFGCYQAIIDASKNLDKINSLILIAPYIFTEKTTSLPLKLILSAPIIGNILLSKVAPKNIEKLLIDSSSPNEVPENYKPMQNVFCNPYVLRPAMFEKEGKQESLKSALTKIKEKNIPVFVIRGKEDRTSGDEQSDSLKKHISFNEEIIQNAGHALPWTKTSEVSKIINKILNNKVEKKVKSPNEGKFGYHDGENQLNNVSSFLTDHVQKNPQKEILTWVGPENLQKWSFDLSDPLPHDSITVGELDGLVGKIGAGLKKTGLKKGDRVIIFVPMSLYLYAAMFAVQKIGAIAVFLDSWARRDQMGLAAEVVDAKMMISVEKAFQYLGQESQIANIPLKVVVGPAEGEYTARLEALMQTPEYTEASEVKREDTALITFTTGSSGTPKGADRTHRFLAAQHYALNRHIPYSEGDADLPVFPIFSLNNLAAGVRTVIPAIDVGVPSEKDALILIAQMKSSNTTSTTLSPSLLRHVYNYCRENNISLDFLKRIVTGGAPVSRDDLIATKEIAPNAEILVLYGSTEVEPMAHIEAKEMISQKMSDDSEWVDEGVNVGKFDSGLTVKYLKINPDPITISKESDWADLEVPKGSVGEIIVSGEHVCENYYNNTEAFARAKIRDEKNIVWHRTGDLGRKDEHGNLWLVGRVHNAINRDNTYLFPVRAEIILKKLPFVEKAAFLGMPDPVLGEKTFAVYTTKDESNEEQIKEIQRIMDKNKVLVDKIVCTDDIPMDPRHHSKVEYGILREKLKENV